MLDRIITYSFYLLIFLTPLFWTSLNYELFEYNKMILTYGITVIIVGTWILKMIQEKSFIFKQTPLDIPLLLFLGANILSTIFSIDTHTSIWGYYSRSNGGLLSIVSYLLLYWAFVSNMGSAKVFTTLKFGLASGFIVALWGILEHFGISPSCTILTSNWKNLIIVFWADCWVQDVQARVFATLGQPNWMAAYLSMLIFPALYFFLTAKNKWQIVSSYLSLITFYLAFTFTYSRGPTLGLIVGLVVFLAITVLCLHPKGVLCLHPKGVKLNPIPKPLLVIFGSFLLVNILFGSALTSFRLVSKFAAPTRPVISLPPDTTPSVTQLEQGGTESGQIRFIVWQGALDIFKHYPVFGSGLETFAYSYYQFRPASHNLTSEWDFLYNKAHNEYLNYLATTGIVGFGTYMLIIGTFIWWGIKRIMRYELRNMHNSLFILHIALVASYISYLIYNFFLFSVVIIAIFFYLFPALAFVVTESTKPIKLSKLLTSHFSLLTSIIYRRPLYTQITKGIIIFITLYLLFSIFKLWYADTLFNKGQNASDLGNPGRAYNLLSSAVQLNKGEPFYRSELAFSAAQAAVALEETEATLSAALKDEAADQMNTVLSNSPNNVSFWRTAIRTFFELSSLDKKYTDEQSSFTSKTLEALERAIQLAPTDPKLYYNKALILDSQGKKEQSIKVLRKALELKPNYLEAKAQLEEATRSAQP